MTVSVYMQVMIDTTIYASPGLMILNADLNACLYGWCYTDTFVCLALVCPYLVFYVVLVSSYRLCCLPLHSCSVMEFFLWVADFN